MKGCDPLRVLGFCSCALLVMAWPAAATTLLPAGIEGAILVQDGKVIFVQPGGSLTVLDAATGSVRLRLPPPRTPQGWSQLLRTSAGVLVRTEGELRMVDLGRLEVAWTRTGDHLADQALVQQAGDANSAAGPCYLSRTLETSRRAFPGCSAVLAFVGDATVLEITRGLHRGRAAIPMDLRLRPDEGVLKADGGLLFVESRSSEVGRLDALDAMTARPLWTYVYPSTLRVGSWTAFLPFPETKAPTYQGAWAEVSRNPPRGAFPVSPEASLTPGHGRNLSPSRREIARVVIDPGPVGRVP